MTIDDTATLTDDDLLAEVRTECARWEVRDDELEAGFGRLFLLRDEAPQAWAPDAYVLPHGRPARGDR